MCATGDFTEHGIKGRHGMLAETVVTTPDQLITLPDEAEPYAVLMEPMSVVSKAVSQAWQIQQRLAWGPKKALVLGAGPIGLLMTFTLRQMGLEVDTAARTPGPNPKQAAAEEAGARYLSVKKTPVEEFEGGYDFVFDASGHAPTAFTAASKLALNGVLCLNSVTGDDSTLTLKAAELNKDLVLGNQLLFGTVNASGQDFTEGLLMLRKIEDARPGLLDKLITKRVALADAPAELSSAAGTIKTVVEI